MTFTIHDLGPSDGLKKDSLMQNHCKKEVIKEKVASFKFIKRNIKLAKYGHGTFSLTDEEKLRVENLLISIDDSELENVEELKKMEVFKEKMISENEKKLYAIDEETKIRLNQIDQQLEIFIQEKRWEENQSKISFLKKIDNEEKQSVNNAENPNTKKFKKKESNRLKEINNLLYSMNSISNEEINPLSVEEVERLVQQSKEGLSLRSPLTMEEKELPSFKPTEEVMAELVSSAKLLMPKFQYKFNEP